ncbi:hypothetical protein VTO73DRAFT_7015 [Trametes versicolor]
MFSSAKLIVRAVYPSPSAHALIPGSDARHGPREAAGRVLTVLERALRTQLHAACPGRAWAWATCGRPRSRSTLRRKHPERAHDAPARTKSSTPASASDSTAARDAGCLLGALSGREWTRVVEATRPHTKSWNTTHVPVAPDGYLARTKRCAYLVGLPHAWCALFRDSDTECTSTPGPSRLADGGLGVEGAWIREGV